VSIEIELEDIDMMPEGPEKDARLKELYTDYPGLQKLLGAEYEEATKLADEEGPQGLRGGGQFVAAPMSAHLVGALRQGIGAYGQKQAREGLEDISESMERGRTTYGTTDVSSALRAPQPGVSRGAGGGVTPQEVALMLRAESGGDPNAVSSAGALGIAQVMPGTARGMGYTPEQMLDPEIGREAGTKYMNQMYDQFGTMRLANAAYNAGPGRVGKLRKKYGNSYDEIEAYLPEETRNYVSKIDKWRNSGY
jgi:hypothetical protein